MPLNSIGDATGRGDVMLVTKEVIGKAFSNCGVELSASYEGDLIIPQGGEVFLSVVWGNGSGMQK